jgi:wobble nucleotide-excising tRNase
MDSQLFFNAYAYIVAGVSDRNRKILPNQVFISTHNYDLFNLLKKKFGDANFYMLDLYSENNKRVSCIKALDTLLRNNDSDYQYLFKKLLDYQKMSDEEKRNLENIYPYPNICRRVLEIFFNFKFPQFSLWDALYKCNELSPQEKEMINEFLHAHSHGNHQSNLRTFSAGYLEPGVVKNVIDLILHKVIEKEDEKHFNGILERINP